MELERLAKVEKWMKLRQEKGMTVVVAVDMVDEPA